MTTATFLMADVNAQAQANREYDYAQTVHPMLIQLQMGTVTQTQIQDAVNAIDAKYPFVTEDLVIDTSSVPTINIDQGE